MEERNYIVYKHTSPSNKVYIGITKQTLYHELMHCYLWSYIHIFNEISEEAMCDISANSHDIIHKIVEDYFEEVD